MRYVNIGRRLVASLLDWVVLSAAGLAFGEYRTGDGVLEVSWQGWRFAVAWIAIPLAYVVLFEWLAGATLGKLAVRIRVRRLDGGRIGLGQSLGRNLARLIDGLPYVIPYLVGGISVLRSPTCQRLGDAWASTVVIAANWKPDDPASRQTPPPMPTRSGASSPWAGGLPPPPE